MHFDAPVPLHDILSISGATLHIPTGAEADPSHNPSHAYVLGINEIHKVQPGDLTFADNPKYTPVALRSAATVLLFNAVPTNAKGEPLPIPAGKHILLHPAPFDAYNALVRHHFPNLYPHHPGVHIPATSSVGHGTRLGHGTFIGEHVHVGNDCIIGPNAVLMPHTTLGNRVRIGAGTVLGGDAFYYKRKPEGYVRLESCGRTILHDDVEIGNNCTIDRGVSGDTIIGQGSKLDNAVHLGHGVVLGANCLIAAQVGIGGKTTLEDNVILWGQVGIQKAVTIGKGAIVTGKSGISKNMPGGVTYSGSPAIEHRAHLRQAAALARLARNAFPAPHPTNTPEPDAPYTSPEG